MGVIRSLGLFVIAAAAEIGGAWLVWQGVREHRGVVWIGAGIAALAAYGFVATFQDDPNFGRILQAAGQALAGRDGGPAAIAHLDLDVQGRRLVSGGATLDLDEAEWRSLEAAVAAPEVEYALTLPGSGGEAEVFFSDLGHGYVTINAEYTS